MQAVARVLLGVACAAAATAACVGAPEAALQHWCVRLKYLELLAAVLWAPRRPEEALYAAAGPAATQAFRGQAFPTVVHFVAQAVAHLARSLGEARALGWGFVQLHAAFTQDAALAHYAFASMILLTRLYT